MNQNNRIFSYMSLPTGQRLSERQKKQFEYLLIFILACCFVLTTIAQEGVNRYEWGAISQYSPSVKDAIKFYDLPEIKDSVKKLDNLKYGIISNPLFPKYEVQQVEAAKLQNEALNKLYRSLFKGGYSPFYSMPYGEFWISSVRARENSWGAHLRHFSSNTHLKDVGYGGFSENAVNLFGKKFYKKHTLFTDFNYDRNVVHYYGYDTTINDLTRGFTRQRYQLFEPKVRLLSHYTDSTHINHDVRLSFYNLQNLHREAENNIRLSAWGAGYINKEKLNVNFLTDFYNHKQSNDTANNLIMSLNPYFEARGSKWKADVGLTGTIDNFYGKTKFYFYQQLNAQYDIYENMIIPYLGISGGLVKNSFRNLATENPFVDTTLTYRNTDNKYNFTGGLKGYLSSHTMYDAKVTYSICNNLNFFVIDYSGNNQIYNRFDVIYDNARVINVNGQLRHQAGEKLTLVAKGNYYHYKTKTLTRAYHRPDFDLTFSGVYNLKSKVIVRADLFIMGNQWALTQHNEAGTNIIKPELIKGWGDLNLEGEYRYSKMLSFFARFNNIAGQRYYRWERFPSQRFSFMLGLTFVPF